MLQMAEVWPTVCTQTGVHIILTTVTNLPETMGLFLVGLVLIISGIVLRRVFVSLDTAVPPGRQGLDSKQPSLK